MTEAQYTRVVLRDYQEESIAKARYLIREGKKRVLIYSATGSGKGEVAVALAQSVLAKGKRVLFIVHRKDLVRQQWERFAKYGMYAGVLQGENTNRPHAELTVASIQTLASRMKFGWNFSWDVVIVDEAHAAAGAKQYQDLFRKWSNLPIIGLTATPFSKGLGREGMFQEMVVTTTIRELIERGFLVDAEIYAPATPDVSKVKIMAGDYNEKQLAEVVDQPGLVGDIVKHWFRLADNQQTVCFATSISHSQHIVEQFQAHGVVAEHLDCYTAEGVRNDIIDRFRAGKIKILSNVGILAEGFDAPATACMILARPTRSLKLYIQMAGRVLRPADGKEKALLIDHSGTVSRLGFPTDDLPLELCDGSKKEASKPESQEKKPRACPECKHVDKERRMVCPKCGHKFVSKQEALENPRDEKLVKLKRLSKEDKQSIYSGLIKVASSKGFQSGWVAHTYRGMTGVWPKDLRWVPGEVSENVRSFVTHKLIQHSRSKAHG